MKEPKWDRSIDAYVLARDEHRKPTVCINCGNESYNGDFCDMSCALDYMEE